MAGPVSLQSGFGRAFAAFLGQWARDDLAFRSYLLGEPSQRGPFVFAPKSEIQDDIGMKLKSAQSYPDQTTFQGISFCLIVSSKYRNHPLITGQPQDRGFHF